MLNLKKISNINNLSAGKPLCGQIATLLILMMVVVLIFILITVNIGQLSLCSTTLSNTADTCVLSLASQLSTKANAYRVALIDSDAKWNDCPPKISGKGGALAVVLAIACAIIGALLAVPTGGLSWQAGAIIGGMIGGAFGGAVVANPADSLWESALVGAIQGALIGAAIAGAGTQMFGPGGTLTSSGTATTTTTVETILTTDGVAKGIVWAKGAGDFLVPYASGAVIPAGTEIISGTVLVPTISAGVAATATITAPVTYTAGQTVPVGTTILSGQVAVPVSAAKLSFDVGLFSAGSIYNAGQQDKITRQNLTTLLKQLAVLPTEYDILREGVIFQGMIAVVDDPNKTPTDLCVDCNDDGNPEEKGGDPCDSDDDGDTKESVPYFQYWRHRRTLKFKRIAEELRKLTGEFIIGRRVGRHLVFVFPGPLARFADFCESQYAQPSGHLCREGIEPADGIIVQVAKALANLGDTSVPFFYKPGVPPKSDESDEEDSGETVSWDEIELVKSDLKDFVEEVSALQKQPIEQLAFTWQTWIKWFVKDEKTQDEDAIYDGNYEMLGTLISGRDTNKDLDGDEVKGLGKWGQELENKRNSLPACIYKGDEITNWPCQDGCIAGVPGQDCFASIDADKDDEFKQAITAIDGLINAIETFQKQAEAYQTAMEDAYQDVGKIADNDEGFDFGGINPVTYKWTDSRGENKVIVEVSPFKIPWLRKKSTRPVKWIGKDIYNKKQLILTDYCDNCAWNRDCGPCDDPGRDTYVRITRKYPAANIKSGAQVLGMVGAYDNYDPLDDSNKEEAEKDGFFSVSKKSRAYYSDKQVGLLKE